MGCLTSSSKEEDISMALQSSKKLKIVIVGLEGSGKTSILQYLKNGKFIEAQPTIGLNVETIQFKARHYLVFDVGGKVRTLWSHYYENLDGLVFVIDTTDPERIEIVKNELKKLGSEIKQKIVLLIYLNKIDLPRSAPMELSKDIQQQESDVIMQRCSAKTGEGIWEGIDKMNKLLDHKFQQ
uniref:Arl_A06 protein n=1 Tax=Paramecium tetraurelia TaxID=5888 RepID=Q3SCY6_PARTE|nr:arl_A06 [Paramecium tetraurelia]